MDSELKKLSSAVAAIGCGLGLAACGGGGGSSTPATEAKPPAQPVLAVPAINVSVALIKFLDGDKANVNLVANDGSLGKASLSVQAEEQLPFVTNGVSAPTRFIRTISFLKSSATGILLSRNIWKLHFDNNVKPLGIGIGHADVGYTDCMSVTVANGLPTSSNASGIYFSGIQSGDYAEEFRGGVAGNYCQTTASTASHVMWSVEAGSPNPYVCITMPETASTSKSKLCIPVNASGFLGDAMWVRVYRADGTVEADYKDSSTNKPLETYSTVIDPKDYYYGTVWRPSDGFVYQAYPETRFSSEQACRNQTAIDWKKTFTASNVDWSCVRRKS